MSSNESLNTTARPEQRNGVVEECFVRDSTAVKLVHVMTYCILVIVSLCGNSAIITVVWKVRRMRKTINFFIVNMCIADLLITLYMPRSISVSFTGYRWLVGGILGRIFCKFSVFMQAVCALRSLSIMGGIQNLIICVKMACSEHLDCGVNIR